MILINNGCIQILNPKSFIRPQKYGSTISPGDPGVGKSLCNSYANLCGSSLPGRFFLMFYALYDVSNWLPLI